MNTENDTPRETVEAVAARKASGVETWEQRIEREKKEAKAAQKKARAKIREVFKALGWREVKADDASATDDRAWLEAVNDAPEWSGLILHASAGGYRAAGKVRFSVEYPGPKVGQKPYDREWPKPEAHASLDRPADVLARDVARRVLPDALKGLEMARKANANSDSYTTRQRANLAAVLGRELEEGETKDGRSRLDGCGELAISYGNCRASSEDVELELHGVPVPVAVAIMELLRKCRKP